MRHILCPLQFFHKSYGFIDSWRKGEWMHWNCYTLHMFLDSFPWWWIGSYNSYKNNSCYLCERSLCPLDGDSTLVIDCGRDANCFSGHIATPVEGHTTHHGARVDTTYSQLVFNLTPKWLLPTWQTEHQWLCYRRQRASYEWCCNFVSGYERRTTAVLEYIGSLLTVD